MILQSKPFQITRNSINKNLPVVLIYLFSAVYLAEVSSLSVLPTLAVSTPSSPDNIDYLSQLETDCGNLTTAQLQEVFTDTFMLAVLHKQPDWNIPLCRISSKAQELCYNYIHAFFDQLN